MSLYQVFRYLSKDSCYKRPPQRGSTNYITAGHQHTMLSVQIAHYEIEIASLDINP